MENIKKRAVVLKNFTSPYIYEAVVILRECDAPCQDRILREAQNLINDYINSMEMQEDYPEDMYDGIYFTPKKRNKLTLTKPARFAVTGLCMCIAAAAIALYFMYGR